MALHCTVVNGPCPGNDRGHLCVVPCDDDDLFEPAGPPPRKTGRDAFGPVFRAQYDNTLCSGCLDYVEPGEDIRADGIGGWVHADDECEESTLVRGPRSKLPEVCQLDDCGCSGLAHP